MSSSTPAQQVTIIEPPRGWVHLGLRDIWQYRDLLLLLVWRDFSARYRQSVLGVGWAVVNPVITMLVYTLVFGGLAKLDSDGMPYPIFTYSALLPWLYFSRCLTQSGSSAVQNSAVLTKVYFPRLILPLSKVFVGLIDFAIQFTLLLAMMAWFGIAPTRAAFFVPVFLLQCVICSLGVGIWATALSVKYRDVQQIVRFLTEMWKWLTPVVYSISLVPEKWRMLYSLNPMVGVIQGFRWAMLGKAPPDWQMLGISTAAMLILLITGLIFFRRSEATFADII